MDLVATTLKDLLGHSMGHRMRWRRSSEAAAPSARGIVGHGGAPPSSDPISQCCVADVRSPE